MPSDSERKVKVWMLVDKNNKAPRWAVTSQSRTTVMECAAKCLPFVEWENLGNVSNRWQTVKNRYGFRIIRATITY